MKNIKDICEVDRTIPIHQLNKMNEKGTKRQDFFPISIIQAIFDKTGIRLDNILSSFNYIFLPYKGNKETTRLQVVGLSRRKSLVISYRDLEDNVIIEMYNSNERGDNEWKKDANWIDFNRYIIDKIREEFVNNVTIIDNLNSNEVNAALSANQGRVLKEMINAIQSFNKEIVEELPHTGSNDTIYFILNSDSTEDNNVYDEYVWIASKSKYEKLGSFTTKIDVFPEGGEQGQVLTKTVDGTAWQDPQAAFPEGGIAGQVLKKTAEGVEWGTDEKGFELPSGGSDGQVLKKSGSTVTWQDDNDTTYENATKSTAGLMSSDDKTKLDNIIEILNGGADGQVLKKTSTGVEWGNDNDTKVTVNNTLSSDSTTEALSAAQGKVLNEKIESLEIPEEYILPTASSSQLGGVKIGEGITIQANGTISAADDVITLTTLYAAKGDIAAMCAAGPYITNLYFINSPVTEDILAGIDTGDYYHLSVKRSTGDNYYETTCSNVADTFSNMSAYFNITSGLIYLKNNVIYHATQGTDVGYFVSNEKGDILTNVARRFETLAEARAFMREKMLALPDIGIVKCTSEEYESGTKDENTLYIIHG